MPGAFPVGLFLLLLVGLLLLWAATVAWTAWLLTHPPRRTVAWAISRGVPADPSQMPAPRRFSEWTFRTRGLDLPVWDVQGDDPGGPVVVMTYGWSDSRIGALRRLEAVAPAASRIIVWEQEGHGDPHDVPGLCRLGTREPDDLCALLERVDDGGRGCVGVVLFGWSLGAGASIVAAAREGGREGVRERVRAVIAEAPYRFAPTPARNVLRLRGMPWRATLMPAMRLIGLALRMSPGSPPAGTPPLRGGSVLSPSFDRAAHAARLACPLLVLHGTEDEVCPIEDGRDIAAAAPEGRIVEIEGGRHNSLWTDEGQRARARRPR
ncbi:MAG: alpha/beta hydrolase [Phycisphaeraceae bacterium]|nr:alpha/beta hydrolase [Phycisphaeraceae bacterium]